eukprot:8399078-Ditylum_brightwellii.AAC.1
MLSIEQEDGGVFSLQRTETIDITKDTVASGYSHDDVDKESDADIENAPDKTERLDPIQNCEDLL